jgi:hypothetical protein
MFWAGIPFVTSKVSTTLQEGKLRAIHSCAQFLAENAS